MLVNGRSRRSDAAAVTPRRRRPRCAGRRARATPTTGQRNSLIAIAVAERDAGDRRAVAIAPHQRDEQRERKRRVGGLDRLDHGRPEQDDAVDAPVADVEQPQRRDERRDHERRRDPVGDAGRQRRERHDRQHRRDRPQRGSTRSERSASGASYARSPMDNGVRLPIELVVEVEREPVVARVRRRARARGRPRERTQKEELGGTTDRRAHVQESSGGGRVASLSHSNETAQGSSARFAGCVTLSCCSSFRSRSPCSASCSDTSTRGRSGSTSGARSGSRPARCSTATPIYPEPTRDNIVLGNPAVYPPVFILLSVPLALLPVTVASWLWFCVLGGCVFAALWILGRARLALLRHRAHVAGRHPRTLLREPHDRHRAARRARVAVSRPGDASRDSRSAPRSPRSSSSGRSWSGCCSPGASRGRVGCRARPLVLVFGAWALIGFEGFGDYPKLLRVVQDVYAERSISVSTVAGRSARPCGSRSPLPRSPGSRSSAWPPVVARRRTATDVRLRSLVGACIVASPIVWPNYAALLFVPIAITWPRLAPAWFFGYAIVARRHDRTEDGGGRRVLPTAGRSFAGVGMESLRAGDLVSGRRHDSCSGRSPYSGTIPTGPRRCHSMIVLETALTTGTLPRPTGNGYQAPR